MERIAVGDKVAPGPESQVEADVLLTPSESHRDRLTHRLQHRIPVRHERLRLAVELAVLGLAQAQARPAKEAPKLEQLVVGHVEQVLDVDLSRVLVPRAGHVVLLVRVEDAVRATVRVRDGEDFGILDLERRLEPRAVVVRSLDESLAVRQAVGAEKPGPARTTRLPEQTALLFARQLRRR